MNQAIQDFVQGKRIAIMGASRSPKKFGTAAAVELKQRGYQVFIVHPEAQEIGGERCYPSMAALPGPVDGVLICVSPKQSAAALREAVQAGVKKIWLQQGADSPEALAAARELGVSPVTGKCILMYATTGGPIPGLHRFHGMINKLIGQY